MVVLLSQMKLLSVSARKYNFQINTIGVPTRNMLMPINKDNLFLILS